MAALLTVLTGCDEPEHVDRDGFRSQLLREMFAAMSRGQSQTVLRQLAKLETDLAGHPFFALVTERERDRITMLGVNECLREGDLGGARRFLRQELARRGKVPVILESESRVAALVALREYVEQAPFETSEEAVEELRLLERFSDRLSASPAYGAWRGEQLEVIAEQQSAERQQALRQLVLECDWRAATDPELVPLVLAQIAATDSEGTLSRTVTSELASTDAAPPSAPDAAMLTTAIRLWTLDAGASRLRAKQDGGPPESMSGRVLAAVHAGRRGNWRQSLTLLEQAEAAGDLPARHMEAVFQPLVFPAEQYLAKPWRSPFPSFTDYLNRIAQIREHAL